MAVPIYLTSGAYQSQNVIANAQRCVNLYLEKNPEDTKPGAPTTHYVRPGKRLLSSPPLGAGLGRGFYKASNGALYAVVGPQIYVIDAAFAWHTVGVIADGTSIVSMADNGEHAGNDLVIVDGTTSGYVITMSTNAFNPIVDGTGLFVGADIVSYLQTYFLFNWHDTQNWYISQPDTVTFNALDVAGKAGYADNISTIGVRQREVWLLGTLTTEPWSLSGAADFPFESIPSTFVPYGNLAVYSMQAPDGSLYWLSRNQQGQRLFVSAEGYAAKRASNHGIEEILQRMTNPADAIGTSFQIGGHTFVNWSFPTDDITLSFDVATKQWSQWAWTDEDGVLRRDRVVLYAAAHDKILGLDWETGDLYEVDTNIYTDDGDVISCIRGFPHVEKSMHMVTHGALTVKIMGGTHLDPDHDPMLNMRYSDDAGQTFTDYMQDSMGKTGQYQASPQFRNLGMARDRVYELYWAEDMKTAMNCAYLEDLEEADS